MSTTTEVSPTPIPLWQTLGISGGAGMFAWCFTHPFEMWKNTVMMAPPGTSQLSSLKATAKKGFYTGLCSGLMRQVVYTTARLGCYPIFRDGILQGEVAMGLKKSADPLHASVLDRAVAGASAGVFASFLSSPVEVCLVLQTTSKEKLSVLQALKCVLSNSGVTGFWSGFGALASRAALVGVSQVAVHDQVLTMLRKQNVKRPSPLNDNIVVNVASSITALIYSAVTMPVEVARVRMSAEAKLGTGVERKYHNVVQCIGRIAKEEGVLAMYDAFFPYFCRCTMHTILCFFTIEYVTRTLREKKAAAKSA
ncbi:putative mitochondrial mitochondrial carrier protein (MCP12) [Leptomonas pyrrhocoris]|uniref:Putative mitochondrial mitochondrial carrier protein (MCP12) n=1 Tax=Leptomonas pyrrhocoris TaxID=157538 RepID=A0A0M9FYM1_LEPPY|nr:putative mitochondrial mitochondrial carrier protein (MCP12) [Leptomonas pyrrhocoris]KPA78617.1 putative mitochondrial mitochondrial carrier protein (MCP12) [Leptomonas pyrrhocoris]|eukprot:XP_015657056.1 putative mitochondrial mitochondrial carrier protein (MCP12) [Leptomonas pyrrhocoris]